VQVIEAIEALRQQRKKLPGTLGLVPTMGALHDGHLALVETARSENDSVLVTIFINPTQFAANEDLDRYPRDLPGDLRLLEQCGVDLVFTPTPEVMYPARYQTYVIVEDVAQGLEGKQRPEHFRGVATVVAKLFNLAQADCAYFGQKDAQQVVVIRRMAYDLNFPLEIKIHPTIREADGLAMSSRNRYLNADERKAAPVLYRALQVVGAAYRSGERQPKILLQKAHDTLRTEALAQVEYVALNDARTLERVESPTDTPLLLSMAVRFGGTRLIDNCLLPLEFNDYAGLTATLGAINT